jgi:predicted DNA-binding protein (MmcQ/YjbR family)
VKAARLRRACLSHAGAGEEFPFGPENSVFKVAGKIFALTRLDAKPLRVSLKCEPEIAVRLRGAHPEIIPGYHLNKRHWNTVDLAGALPDEMVLDMIEDSYDLVVASLPAKTRDRLHWTAVVDEATAS